MATRTDLRPRGVEGYTVARDELRALIASALDKSNLTKGSKATIEVWFSIGEYGYLRSIDLPVHDVIALSTSTPHDLADFIRTFGDRLDTNHSLWYNWAKS